jgi:hypothetical protein
MNVNTGSSKSTLKMLKFLLIQPYNKIKYIVNP